MLQENTLQREFIDACRSGYIEVVESLLDKGALVNQADGYGSTPLWIAYKEGRALVELLLDRGADINQANEDGLTPLHLACEDGAIVVVELLLDRGADINQANEDGFTPFLAACAGGARVVVELLLDRGADINQVDSDGETPLWAACCRGYREVAELLLARGADVNQANNVGATPLSISCARGHLAISELLILSNKFNGYTPNQLKLIIFSCANNRYRPRGRANAMSFCIIAYRCYKQLQLIDPSYTPNDRERSVIERGRVQQERQTHTLLWLLSDYRKKRAENVLPEEICHKVTTYLPLSWLRNDDNTTTHQSSVS